MCGCNSVAAEWCSSRIDDIVWDGGATAASGRVRYGHCLGVPHASAQPSAATASAIISSGSRASITATSTSSRCTRAPRYRLRPVLRPCVRALSGVHMQPGLSARRFVRGLDSMTAQYSPLRGTLRIRTGAVRLCGSGSAGLAAAHQRTHSGDALLRSKPRKRASPRDDARAALAAPSTACFARASRKQTTKQNKQTNKSRKTERRVGCGSGEHICAGNVKKARCSMRATSAKRRRCGAP